MIDSRPAFLRRNEMRKPAMARLLQAERAEKISKSSLALKMVADIAVVNEKAPLFFVPGHQLLIQASAFDSIGFSAEESDFCGFPGLFGIFGFSFDFFSSSGHVQPFPPAFL